MRSVCEAELTVTAQTARTRKNGHPVPKVPRMHAVNEAWPSRRRVVWSRMCSEHWSSTAGASSTCERERAAGRRRSDEPKTKLGPARGRRGCEPTAVRRLQDLVALDEHQLHADQHAVRLAPSAGTRTERRRRLALAVSRLLETAPERRRLERGRYLAVNAEPVSGQASRSSTGVASPA
jgi:hypothetical protein